MPTIEQWRLGSLVIWATAAAAAGAQAQVAVFDAAANRLSIPSVNVGPATYTAVELAHDGNYVFSLRSAAEQKPVAGGGSSNYDVATGLVSIPAVKVGSETYVDVTLRLGVDGRFALQAATLLPTAVIDELKAMLAAYDAMWATDVPASGAQLLSFNDACYRSNGRTRDYLVADFDLERERNRLRERYRVGARRLNLQVLAWRSSTNPDGSTRREADVQYEVAYADGSRAVDVVETLIAGSSAGSTDCAMPQSGSGWRFYGNQRLVGFSLQARMLREERFAIGNGAALNPPVRYRRDIRVAVSDPLGRASHVVVSGPGPTVMVNGVDVPWSWKMVSPRVMRDAPEFAGKPGNYVDWKDDDSFRYCGVAGTGTPLASQADCLSYGAPGDNWGVGYTSTLNAAADAQFAAQGWAAGGVYRIDVYNDDGWKSVDGQAGRMPVATYYETLKSLPRTFVEMAGSGSAPTANDRFSRLNLGSIGAAGVAENARRAAPQPLAVSWNALPALADGTAFRLFQTWEYLEGPKKGAAAGASWPRSRVIEFQYPGSNALSIGAWPVSLLPADMSARSYFEYTLWFTDRNQGVIQSRVTFQ